MTDTTDPYLDNHYIQRSNWLRAAVLGANDGILSTASLAIGVAAASDLREPIVLATLAGLVAGALSMAAGEYVSVSSQTDIEQADIEREKVELAQTPELELKRLSEIYIQRGLKQETALIGGTIRQYLDPELILSKPSSVARRADQPWMSENSEVRR
jgi:VIT1/CCC1 family predicted Fe2+/Mn2+ transporter